MSKRQKNIFFIIMLLLIILNGFLLFNASDVKIDALFNIRFIVSIIAIILITLLLLRKNQKTEKKFIIIYVILEIFYLIFFPINNLFDETHHFDRRYEVTKGHLISEKYRFKNGYLGVTKVTKNVAKVSKSTPNYKGNFKVFNLKDKKSKQEYVELTNVSMYSFICYIPQALGVLFGRVFNLPIIFWGYLARLFNFIMFVFLLRFSLKNIPYKKTTLMFIALLPMTMQTAVSMSADCMTLGVSLDLISYILKLINNKNEMMIKKDYIILGILSVLLSLSKIVYLPICLLMFLIPKNKFSSFNEKYKKLGIIFAIALVLNLIWFFVASSYLASQNDSHIQLLSILKNPIRFIYIIVHTYIKRGEYYIYTMMGAKLASLDFYVATNYISLDVIIAIFLMMFDTNNVKIDKVLKRFSLLIFLIVVILISISLYVQWTHAGSNAIDGIQGRYFLPIFLLLFISLNTNNFQIKNKDIFNQLNMLIFLIIENVYVLTYTISYFFNI